jgi:hypothetical protein
MWYVSCARWELGEDPEAPPRHHYHVRCAQSEDGVHWRREGEVAIDFKDHGEYAMGRPCVVRDGDRYRMWFAARGATYRLAYAESADANRWERDDSRVELRGDAEQWDAQMQTYPAVFERDGRRYLLYNGNGYGRSGIGYAVGGED